MKSIKITTILVLALGLFVCLPKAGRAEPMGTAFTYQGRLIDANTAADGLYDLQFKLFDALSAGNQITEDVNMPDVDVVDGYFTFELDFGNVFDGNKRWLEIGVRPGNQSDPNVYTKLSPRIEVTAAPYAMYVSNADRVDGYDAGNSSGQVAVSNGTLCANLNADRLDGLDASAFLSTSSDYGRSGISSTLYEGTTPLSNKYLGISAMAVNSDQLDGLHASAFLSTSSDYGRSGVASTLYEGTTPLSNKYLGISATATNSDMLDGLHASSFLSTASDYGRSGVASNLYEGSTALTDKYVKKTGDSMNGSINGDLLSVTNSYAGSARAIYGYASDGGAVTNYGGFFWARGSSARAVYGKATNSGDQANYGGYFEAWGTGGHGVHGKVTKPSGMGVYGENWENSTHGYLGGQSRGVYGYSSSYTGVDGSSSSGTGVYGYSTSGKGVYGETSSGYAGYFWGNVYMTANCSALSFTDRTPYPKDLATAYQAVMSMERLPDGQYDKNNKEVQLDHSKLSDFIRSEDGNRDLSATVSALNEVVKDLIRQNKELRKRIEALEQKPAERMVK